MNPPLPVCLRDPQAGSLDLTTSFSQVDQANGMLINLKRAEDGRGVILRLVEAAGEETRLALNLPQPTIAKAYRTDPVERDLESLQAEPHALSPVVKPNSITSIRLVFSLPCSAEE